MPKALKIGLAALGALLVLLIGIAIALPLLIDPNDYRDTIATKVEEATGRTFSLGEIELKVFPWVKLRVNDAELGNAEGFGDEPFASVQEADVGVKVLPLLFDRQLVVSAVTLNGLTANLARNADGVSNWDDLAGADEETPEAPEAETSEGGFDPKQIDIGGISILNAAISFDDRQADQSIKIEDFSLETGRLAIGEAFDVTTGAQITLGEPAMTVRWDLSSHISPDEDFAQIAIEDLKTTIKLEGEGLDVTSELTGNPNINLTDTNLVWPDLAVDFDVTHSEGAAKGRLTSPVELDWTAMKLALSKLALDATASSKAIGKPVDITLRSAIDYDGTANSASVKDLSLKAGEANLTGNFNASKLDSDAPQAQGKLNLAAFSPRKLAAELGIELPPMKDDTALQKLQFSTDIGGGTNGVALKNIVLVLDDTTARGSAEVRDFATQAIRFDLNVDKIDADRYMAPSEEMEEAKEKPAEEASGDINEIELPTEMLDALNVDGVLRIGELKVSGLTLSDAQVNLSGAAGQPKRQQIAAKLYGGDITLDHRYTPGDNPGWALKAGLDAFQAAPFLKDFIGKDYLSGLTKFDIDLRSSGDTVGDLRAALNGQLSAQLRDGAVKGFNLGAVLRRAEAAFTGDMAAARAPATLEETDFSALSIAAKITNGVLETTLLDAASPLFRLDGGGKVNLVNETLDFLAKPTVVATATGQGGKELEALRGLTIPIALTGSLFDPKVRFDFKEALKGKALSEAKERLGVDEDELRAKVKAEEGRAREKIETKIQEELGDGAADALRGLFGGRSRATPTPAPEPEASPAAAAEEAEPAS
jgi:AsmA protein